MTTPPCPRCGNGMLVMGLTVRCGYVGHNDVACAYGIDAPRALVPQPDPVASVTAPTPSDDAGLREAARRAIIGDCAVPEDCAGEIVDAVLVVMEQRRATLTPATREVIGRAIHHMIACSQYQAGESLCESAKSALAEVEALK